MYNKLATLEPLINSIKQHPVRWAVGSLAVKMYRLQQLFMKCTRKEKPERRNNYECKK